MRFGVGDEESPFAETSENVHWPSSYCVIEYVGSWSNTTAGQEGVPGDPTLHQVNKAASVCEAQWLLKKAALPSPVDFSNSHQRNLPVLQQIRWYSLGELHPTIHACRMRDKRVFGNGLCSRHGVTVQGACWLRVVAMTRNRRAKNWQRSMRNHGYWKRRFFFKFQNANNQWYFHDGIN